MCFNILLLLHFRYDPISKTCIEFKFGGCDGNANNYKTQADVSLFPFNDNLLYNLYLLQLHFFYFNLNSVWKIVREYKINLLTK